MGLVKHTMAIEASLLDTQNEWLNLGFKFSPFSSDNKSNHYRSQSFVSCLNKMLTLDTTNTCISILNGESGSGKTTCLKTFSKTQSIYHNVYIPASSGLSPINLQKVIQLNTGVKTQIHRNPAKEQVVKLLRQLSSLKYKIRIIIDDAEKLPQTTLSLLDIINQTQPTGDTLQFLLASTNPIQSHFPANIYVLNLTNLSQKETQKYIMLRLTRALSNTEGVNIPQSVIDKVYHLSQGNIVRINNLASVHICNHLITHEEQQDTMSSHNDSHELQRKQTLLYLVLPLAILQIISVYYAISPAPKAIVKKLTAMHSTPKVEAVAAKRIISTPLIEQEQATAAETTSTTHVDEKNIDNTQVTLTKTDETIVAEDPAIIASVADTAPEALTAAVAEPTPTTEAPTPITATYPDLSNGWVLQLAALDTPTQVSQFTEKASPGIVHKIWSYPAKRGKAEKIIVVLGPLESKNMIDEVKTNHGNWLKKVNAWTRSSKSVQQELPSA